MKNNLFKNVAVQGILAIRTVTSNPAARQSFKSAIVNTMKNVGNIGIDSSLDSTVSQAFESVLKAKEIISDKDGSVGDKIKRTIKRLKRDFQDIKEDSTIDILLKGKSMISIKNGRIYFRKDKIVNTLLDVVISFTDSFVSNLFTNVDTSSVG